MNNRQEAKLNMNRTVESVCIENASVFAGNVAFSTAFDEFKAKLAEIISTAQEDAVVITGITAEKNVSKENLCRKAAEIASVTYAYAVTTGNETLKMESDFPVSRLLKTREETITSNCQNIHDKAAANRAALADYGITPLMLADLQNLIDTYAADTPKPRAAISHRKAQTANLAELFDQADYILKERMDRIVVIFRAANPEFVAVYENARRIVEPPTITTQLKGTVIDKANNTPIENAVITAVRTENDSGETFTAATGADGEYRIKPLLHGEYKITVTAETFAALEAEGFDIKLGEINRLNVEMVK